MPWSVCMLPSSVLISCIGTLLPDVAIMLPLDVVPGWYAGRRIDGGIGG